jgi:hypothetical protein
MMIDSEFIHNFNNDILPIYQNHEDTFDKYGIHGKLHISRCIIFANFMYNFYESINVKNLDNYAIKYAISFHDSGRIRNGIDYWEKDSSKNCFIYLLKNEHGFMYCKYVADLIIKNRNNDINKNIVLDSDVLDIMRPSTGRGGRLGFRESNLVFLSDYPEYKDVRDNLIEDAWKLIEYTEGNKNIFNNDHIEKLMKIINTNELEFKVLNNFH